MNQPRPRAMRALVATVVMLAPSLAVLSAAPGAVALDNVPFADGPVPWVGISGIRNLLYFRQNDEGESIMTTSPPGATDLPVSAGARTVPYAVGAGADIPGTNAIAQFRSSRLTHEVNITGDNALTVQFWVQLPPSSAYTWTVGVRSEGPDELVGTETWTDSDADAHCEEPVDDAPTFVRCVASVKLNQEHNRRFDFRENSRIRVDIQAAAPAGDLPVNLATWGLRIGDPDRPTFLELRAENAVKAATWTADKDSIVSKVFRPVYKKDVYNRVDAFFAIKSAFGSNDICAVENFPDACPLADAQISWRANRTAYPVGLANLTHIDLEPDDNSTDDQGIVAWRFPKELWDIGRWPFPSGEFTLESSFRIRRNDPAQAENVRAKWDFVISTQQITLKPYDDADSATQPTPLERQDHELAPGGTTTFLVLARNDGRSHDNLTLRVDLRSAQPAFGWQARVHGPRLTGANLLPVAPGAEELFLVTISAPAEAQAGQSAVFTVTATSTIDPQVKSNLYAVIATVSNTVREDVGVVVRDPVQRVRPGLDNDFTAYVWNRGNRPANLTMTLREVTTEGWNATLAGSADRYRFTATSVPPGDIYPITVRVRPDSDLSIGSDHNVTLNVTRAAGGGPGAEAGMSFRLTSFASFRLEVLRGINNDDRHYLEMACPEPPSPSPTWIPYCSDDSGDPAYQNDSVQGTYFRFWITNTGDVSARYEWSADDARELTPQFPADQRNDNWGPVQFGYRDLNGDFSTLGSIDLAPDETAEIYAWVPHQGDAGSFKESTLQFEIVVNNTATKQQLRRTVLAAGLDSHNNGNPGFGASYNGDGYRDSVKLEAVERTREYVSSRGSTPKVDVTSAGKGQVTKFVDLSGVPQYFYARFTHGYSIPNPEGVRLDLKGITAAKELGWNITMRPRTGVVEERLNPWRESLNLTNRNEFDGNRYESFKDYELEIQVRPPINGSAKVAAGETRTFTLQGGGAQLEFTAIVSQLANVTLNASKDQELVHAGQQAAFALLLSNQGSIRAPVELKARILDEQKANLWSLSPNAQNLDLAAHENRTLALLVGAPASAVAGDTVTVNVSAEFAKVPNDPNSVKVTRYLDLDIVVRPPSKLRLTPLPNAVQSAPGGLANFTLEVRNLDNTKATTYKVEVSPLPNWNQSAPSGGQVQAGSSARFAYLLEVPSDVLRDRSYASVVKVTDVSDPDNFEVAVVHVNIIGGQPFPIVSAAKSEDLVNRDGTTRFLMGVKNLGNAAGTFPLEAKAGDNRWSAHVENLAGQTIRDVTVTPNENVNVYLVVRAPRSVPEGTALPVTLTAFSPNFDRNSASTVRALIHDYGVDVEVRPARADVIAGQGVDFTVKVTNLGNGNDTLNLSADLQGLGDWTATFSTEQVTLNPGASADVSLTIRSPRERLPVARSYTMSVFGGSVGGSGLGLPKNDSAPIVLSVLNYRSFDVDSDGFLELAVDRNKRTADGFEHFLEIFTQGQVTQVVDNLSGKEDGRLDFLLDVPEEGSYDGVADLYYDPQEPFVYVIEFTPDVNGDATPDYLLDTDNDGVIDHAWDTATRTLWAVTVIRAFGGTAEQYLVDLNGDGKPDRYFDPAKNLVTRTVPQDDGRVGILTGTGDKNPSKYYDVNSGEVSDARVSSLGDFARTYWYFFLAFLLVLVVFGAVLAKRRK